MVGGSFGAEKVTCLVKDVLEPCLLPFTYSTIQPSAHCCQALTEQQSCLCEYIKRQAAQAIFNSPNAHRTYKACNIPSPSC